MAFVKAQCKNVFIKLGIYGISGSGKTWTSLAIAKGIAEQCGSRIAVIDTENHSAERYADRFDFDVDNLDEKSAKGYMAAMQEAVAAGYKVLVIDSLSHEWEAVLEYVDKQESNNNMRAWAKATPLQRKFIDFIMGLPCHVIATMRSKTEWVIGQNDKGRTTVERRGLAPVQGKDIEYNFDILLEINRKHSARFLKSRIGEYQDQIMERPGEGLGKEIYEWTHRKQEAPREAMPNSKPDSMNSKSDSMNLKPDSMNSKLDSMNSKLDSMNSKPDSMNLKADSMNSKLDSMNSKPDSMNSKLDSMNSKLDSMNSKPDSMNLKADSIEGMPPQPRSPVDQQATAERAAQVADIMALTETDWNGYMLMSDEERDDVRADCERLGANLDEIKRKVESYVNFRELQAKHGMYKGGHKGDLGFNSGTASEVSLVTPPRAPAREQAASGAVSLGVKQRCFP